MALYEFKNALLALNPHSYTYKALNNFSEMFQYPPEGAGGCGHIPPQPEGGDEGTTRGCSPFLLWTW
jgi:hypothetical protein